MKIPIKFDIWSFSYNLMGKYTARYLKYFKDLRISLLKSRFKVSLEAYVSFLMLISVSVFIGSTFGSIIYLSFFLRYNTLLAVILSFPIGLILGAVSFAIVYAYPALKAGSMATKIDDDLPYATAHMNVLATAGASPEQIIRSVASVPGDAVSDFMKDIVRDIDLLGMDIITALNNAKERAPSRTLESFLAEMVSVVSTGGNVQEFLSSYGREILGTKAIEAKEFSETLATMAEVFIIMMVVFPLLMIVMLSIMSLVGGEIMGISLNLMMWLITYIIVPILGLSFLIILDQIMPTGE